MHLSRKRAALSTPIVLLALAAAACGGSSGTKAPSTTSSASSSGATAGKSGGTFRLGIVEPTAIDPYNSQESEGILVTKALFTQLVSLDKDANIIPGVAKTFTPNTDCSEWTFNLVPGTKFSNGAPVTAAAFIRGWTRAATKDAASDVAYHMGGVAGFDELQGGKTNTFSGLSAPDDNTLVVKMSKPDCEFDKKTLQPVMSPVPVDAGAASNKTFNDMPIGNGAFMLKEPWQHDKSITMVRNPQYSFTKANLDEVDLTILPSEGAADAEYRGFKNGQFDYARIPPELLPQAKSTYDPKGGFINEVKFGINYLLPNVVNKPLDNAKARMAISYAIDRDAIINGVFKGFQTKATSLIPPTFKQYYQPGVCASCEKQDTAKAKQLALESGLTPGTTVNLAFNTGGGHEAWIQAVSQQLKDVLGLNVNVQPGPFKELLKNEKAPNASGLFRAAWGADYPTPDNFLYPLLATEPKDNPGDNRGRYSNPAFDALLTQERAAKTIDARAPIVKNAEQLAIGQDLALIPLWYRTQYRVFDSGKYTNVDMDFFEDPTIGVISLK